MHAGPTLRSIRRHSEDAWQCIFAGGYSKEDDESSLDDNCLEEHKAVMVKDFIDRNITTHSEVVFKLLD